MKKPKNLKKKKRTPKINSSGKYVNPKHKDCLFRMIFHQKQDLLNLYNAINHTHYTNPDDLSIYTIDDAVYISYKNDVSYLINETLNLYEHQSTLNPNMPLRGLIYLTRNYETYIQKNNLDIYSNILQPLPLPQYIIFYNGIEQAPECAVLKLTDAFPIIEGKKSCLECEATFLNINYGYNKELMKHCKKLEEYALFIHYIRKNTDNGMFLEDAVDKAADDCIKNHILENFLIKNKAEVKGMVLSTFNQANHDRILKEYYIKHGMTIGQERGIAIGQERGIAIGQSALLKLLIIQKLDKGRTVPQIADELEQPEETIIKMIKEISSEHKST